MSTKTWTSKADFDGGAYSSIESVEPGLIKLDGPRFGSGNFKFNGSSSLLTVSSAVALGTDSFVVDFWVRSTMSGSNGVLYNQGIGDNQNFLLYFQQTAHSPQLCDGGGNGKVAGVTEIHDGDWHHVAIVRESTATDKTYIYIDGTKDATGTFSMNVSATTGYLGAYNGGVHSWYDGDIDEFRICKGTDRGWTGATITVPTRPHIPDSSDELLLHADGNTTDSSDNGLTVTPANITYDTLAASGTWTEDFDSGSATSGWGNLSWNNSAYAWTIGGDLNTARQYLGGCGSQIAGLSFAGYFFNIKWGQTEEYNGSSWCSSSDVNTERGNLGSAGTQTAGLCFGGFTFILPVSTYFDNTEEYDGSSWSSGNGINIARGSSGGAGTQSAALFFGGTTGSGLSGVTEEYDGTSWSSGGDLTTVWTDLAGCGTQTAGLSFGGDVGGGAIGLTEEYNGSSWSSGTDLNVVRTHSSGCGTQTAGLCFGGTDGARIDKTEEYDGSTWALKADLNVARYVLAGAGTVTAGLSFGGGLDGSTASSTTEEFAEAGSVKARVKSADSEVNLATANYYPGDNTGAGAWSSGGDLNSITAAAGGGGTQTAGIMFGGFLSDTTTTIDITEEYNGSAWSSGGDLNTPRNYQDGCGLQSAALSCGGRNPTNPCNIVEEYNGTSWSSGGDLVAVIAWSGACGTQSAGLVVAGYISAYTNLVQEYNGTSWSSGGDFPNSGSTYPVGIITAALAVGGYHTGVTHATDECYDYDGTSWCTASSLNTNRRGHGCFGTQTSAIACGGYNGGFLSSAEEYNGTSWSTVASLPEVTYYSVGIGNSSFGMNAGREFTGSTQEWTKAWVSSYYTTQPQDVECPDGRWYRIEMTLTAGSSPEVTEINQNYGEEC